MVFDLLVVLVTIGGIALGAWKGFAWQPATLFSIILGFVFAITLFEGLREPVLKSRMGHLMGSAMMALHPVLPDAMHEVLHDHIHHLDEPAAAPPASATPAPRNP